MALENRTAVITGASGGLGTTLTRDLSALKLNLALLDNDDDKLDALTKIIGLPEPRVLTRTVNLLNTVETKSAAEAVVAKFGSIDILLHVVGGWTGGKTLLEAPRSDLEFMLNQHIWTSFNVVQAFVPYLVKNGWGRIVMITSPFASRPNAKGGPYAIGKAGQEALMLTLSQELKGTGVTANLLQAKTIDVRREKVSAPTTDNAAWTTPEELSAAVQYLLSDPAGVISGARLPMYGMY
jgi:NAD(P)-dependent dehydrogenase (short-subunit alcohol dehydrogenase family)